VEWLIADMFPDAGLMLIPSSNLRSDVGLNRATSTHFVGAISARSRLDLRLQGEAERRNPRDECQSRRCVADPYRRIDRDHIGVCLWMSISNRRYVHPITTCRDTSHAR
jgi:hypothetical protein